MSVLEIDGAAEWLASQFDALTTEISAVRPSEWAEKYRYLQPSETSLPGYFRFEVVPYLREIVDCLGVDSPVREVSIMKGVQLGFTSGIIENAIGYYIAHVATAPMMMVTADAELAQLRMSTSILPMLQHSELLHLIKSSDAENARKTGKTDKKIEWIGGGFLIPFGARNANKLRSIPIRIMLRDEIDAWPAVVGADGDPLKLTLDRTATYENSRKVVDVSTPLIRGQSKIAERFAAGDQRYYHVCCVACGHPQVLRWRRNNAETGEVSGIVWDMDGAHLVPGSVRYLCEACGHPHTNDDKARLLSPEYGAEWRATARAANPAHRSYHLSALYSPPGMQSWEACVRKWLDAWDVGQSRVRDVGKLQVVYNNVFGEPFEMRGEKLRFETVSQHRRDYRSGEIPNSFALDYCGSRVLLLTCTVDVHRDNLAVAVIGWCRDRRAVLIEYERFEGDTEQLDDAGTWGRLRELIEAREYIADDGARYGIDLTLVDSGYRTDDVYRFCADYTAGVYPIQGRQTPPKNAAVKEFSPYSTPMGTTGYSITVDLYKDRWSSALRRGWDGQELQPVGHFNAPIDIPDRALKELTTETKREKVEKSTGKRLGFEWYRPSGVANELWDLLIYANAALDLIAWDTCVKAREMTAVDWGWFYEFLIGEAPFIRGEQ